MSDVSKSNIIEAPQSILEAKLAVIFDKIKTYERLGEELQNVKNAHDVLFSIIKDVKDHLQDLKADAEKRLNISEKRHGDQESSLAPVSGQLQQLYGKSEQLKGALEEHQEKSSSSIAKLGQDIQIKMAEGVTKKELNAHLNALRENLDKLEKMGLGIQKDHGVLKESLQKVSADLSSYKNDQDSFNRNAAQNFANHRSKVSDLDAYWNASHKKLLDAQKKHEDDVASSLKSVHSQHDSHTGDIAVLRSDLKSNSDSAAVNVEGAVVRVNNVEAQLKAMDKKVEKLSLQLSKYELLK